MALFEDLPALSPLQFFSITAPLYFCKGALKPQKSFLLPATDELLGEEAFADVYASWSYEKLSFYVVVKSLFQSFQEQAPQKGDSVEIFLDTRDLKTKSSISKFCHHFIFYPVEVQNFYGREITRFRNEDMHKLCHPEDLHVDKSFYEDSYHLHIEIPSFCLHGYDPTQFSRLGFTYRINRASGPSQHFAVSSDEYTIESHPATWGTCTLTKEES